MVLREFKIFFILAAAVGVFSFSGHKFFWPEGPGHYEYLAYSGESVTQDLEKEVKKPLHVKTPEAVKGIYMTSWIASRKDLREGLIKLIEETELNTVVIDVKDYTGKIAFEVSDPYLQKIGAAEKRITDVKELIDRLHGKNIYAVARIAAFQDPYMVGLRPDLAVKKNDGKTVWKDYKGAVWLDPCSREAWKYVAAIGREAEAAGFDELNFDYIRFPSDGNMKDIKYNLCNPSIAKSDLLEEFFIYLDEELADVNIPKSADLFGMVTVNTDDLNIGQVLEKAEPYFDYIMPMVYPSHYPKGYNGYQNPAAHPYEIIKLGMSRAAERLVAASSTPSKLRPWLQDFNLGATYDAAMIRKQKQAVYDSGLDSWVLWSPSNKYTTGALDK